MNKHPEAPPLPLSRRRKNARAIWRVIAVGLFGAVFVSAIYFVYQGSRFAHEVEKAHAQGLPVTLAELDQFYHDDVNADRRGDDIVSVLAKYDDALESKDGVFYWDRSAGTGERPTSDALSHMREHLQANREYLDGLHSVLANGTDVRYPMELWKGFQVEFPHLAEVRNALRMFSIEQQVALADHDTETVLASLSDSRSLVETLARDPLLIAQMVRIGCHSIARSQLEYVLNSVSPTDEQLRAIVAQLKTIELDGMVSYGLVGDRCVSYPEISLERATAIRWLLGLRPAAEKGFHYANNLNAFLVYSEVIEIGNLPIWERNPALKRLSLSFNSSTRIVHLYDGAMTDWMVRAYAPENRALTDLRIAVVGVSVLLYARTHQGLPSSLDNLVPDYLDSIPQDPFDGKLLRYEQIGEGFVVYGVGDDCEDDGGKPPAQGKKLAEDGDWLFRVLDARSYLKSE